MLHSLYYDLLWCSVLCKRKEGLQHVVVIVGGGGGVVEYLHGTVDAIT